MSEGVYDSPDRVSFVSGYRAATRALMFETDLPEFPVASHGGSLTLLEFEGSIFGVTCAHALADFDWQRLVITQSHIGGFKAPPLSIFKLSSPTDHAIQSDILDLVLIEFHPSIGTEWFIEKPKRLDASDFAACRSGDELCAIGFIKHRSTFERSGSNVSQGELVVYAQPHSASDIALRSATATVVIDAESSLTGMSGGPVFRLHDRKLCGIMVRGGIDQDGLATIHFIEATDLLEVRLASRRPGSMHTYSKRITD